MELIHAKMFASSMLHGSNRSIGQLWICGVKSHPKDRTPCLEELSRTRYIYGYTPPSLMAFVVDGVYLAGDFLGEELPSFSCKPSETELEGPRPRTKQSCFGHQLRRSQMQAVMHQR